MYHAVTHVTPTEEYELLLEFDNGERRVFDLRPLLNFGRFSELSSLESFRKVRVSFDTVEWENGLDLDPEYLYNRSTLQQ
ncbi:MAG: DUF2442 domain-containing protein [Chitinivibrionales bacterium]|nr:DUF2442 domain-containing protein [Chitinivibrionales bacterium]